MSQGAALFGGPQQPRTTHLLQFKAGKMTVDNENWVKPDPRKGWVYVYLSDDKLHLCWIDRKTGLVEEGASKPGDKNKIQLQDLRQILSSMSGPNKRADVPIDLNDAVNIGSLRTLLEKPEVQARLLPHLPTCDPEAQPASDLVNITTNIQSSQFKATLKSFSTAFQTGELAQVLSEFKLGAKADEAAKNGDLVAFSQALQTSGASTSAVNASGSIGAQKPPQPTSASVKPDKKETTEDKDKPGETAMDTD